MHESLAVISNTSPLFYLHCIDRTQILHQLYGRVHITGQVADELGAGGVDAAKVGWLEWIDIRQVCTPATLNLVPDLGAGEASSIALALELGSSTLLLLDDRLARRIAGLHRLRMTGTAGVLMKAKENGLIPAIRPLLGDLIKAGFHLRTKHMDELCRLVGE